MKNELIPKLINGVGIILAYVSLIIESNDMEPIKYYSLSAAAKLLPIEHLLEIIME